MPEANGLHLPDLTIKGFRGIYELSIPRLGRVTLLAGRNSVGKTTVLDAVRVYAARGRFSVIANMLLNYEEAFASGDEDGEAMFRPDIRSLFYGWRIPEDACISIGPGSGPERLTIRPTVLDEEQSSFMRQSFPDFQNFLIHALETSYGDNRQINPLTIYLNDPMAELIPRTYWNRVMPSDLRALVGQNEPPAPIVCELLGPGLLDKGILLRFWDQIALTDDEESALDAMRLILGDDIERIAVVGDNSIPTHPDQSGRRAVVRLKGHKRPVPLRSLGDGALRLFGVALAIANSRGGFLLIDEAENGIHYTLQKDFWRMVLQSAQENNVQVIATTHSWDCIKGFAQAATESEDVEGALVRISGRDGGLSAVEYPEEELLTAAKQGIEVR